jgi:Ca2+/Na+ antiporter
MVPSTTEHDGVSQPELDSSVLHTSLGQGAFKGEYGDSDVNYAPSNHVHDLEKATTLQDEPPGDMAPVRTVSTGGPVHSVFGKHQKLFIVLMASLGGFFSPVSANIYFPSLNSLARDLNVSNTTINLTLTSYMVSLPKFATSITVLTTLRYSKVLPQLSLGI